MSKALDEMRKAEQHLTNMCDCQNCCGDCPLDIFMSGCVLIKLREAITKQSIDDWKAEAEGE